MDPTPHPKTRARPHRLLGFAAAVVVAAAAATAVAVPAVADVGALGETEALHEETSGDLYRSSDGFVYLRNSNTAGTAGVPDIRFFFGNPGDEPLP